MAGLGEEVSPSPSQALHLFRRHLLCPICSSLLNQAASLPCTHNFCRSCIHESLIRVKACPVCQLPSTQREIRGAPQMDGLVNVIMGIETTVAPEANALLLAEKVGQNPSRIQQPLKVSSLAKKRVHVPQHMDMNEDSAFDPSKPFMNLKKQVEGMSGLEMDGRKRNKLSLSTLASCPRESDGDTMQEFGIRNLSPLSQKTDVAHIFADELRSLQNDPSSWLGEEELLFADGFQKLLDPQMVEGSSPELNSFGLVDSDHDEHKGMLNKRDGLATVNSDGCIAFDSASILQFDKNEPREGIAKKDTSLGKGLETNLFDTMESKKPIPVEEQNNYNKDEVILGNEKKHFPQAGTKKQDLGSKMDVDIVDAHISGKGQKKATQVVCAFCKTSGNSQSAGPMIHYKGGVPVEEGKYQSSKLVHVHKFCAEWAPAVYFDDDVAKNLSSEILRGKKIKCSSCSLPGAALGCCLKRCRRSFHYPCAQALPCRWDDDNFVMLCPEHASSKFPQEKETEDMLLNEPKPETQPEPEPVSEHECDHDNDLGIKAEHIDPKLIVSKDERDTSRPVSEWVLCGSALNNQEKEDMACFATMIGAKYCKNWESSVTHLVTGTDLKGAARRTFKYLMANLEGKWILTTQWVSASRDAGKALAEDSYEVNLDIYGMVGGPKLSRCLGAVKGWKLFEGIDFYFKGHFEMAYRRDLYSLVIAGGGDIVESISMTGEVPAGNMCRKRLIVVYNMIPLGNGNGEEQEKRKKRAEDRRLEAKSLATALSAHAAPHVWILDSIAASKLQHLS